MDGNLISYSVKNFFGGYNTYDANGNLISRSYKNIFGGYNTYDKYGNKKRVSRKGFWDVMLHFDIENPDPYESIVTVKRTSSNKTTASHYKNSSVQVADDKVYNSEPSQQSKVSVFATVATEPKEKTTKSKATVSNSYTENVKAAENVKKVVSEYISKARIDEIRAQLEKRKHIEAMIKSLQEELAIANKVLEAEL